MFLSFFHTSRLHSRKEHRCSWHHLYLRAMAALDVLLHFFPLHRHLHVRSFIIALLSMVSIFTSCHFFFPFVFVSLCSPFLLRLLSEPIPIFLFISYLFFFISLSYILASSSLRRFPVPSSYSSHPSSSTFSLLPSSHLPRLILAQSHSSLHFRSTYSRSTTSS